MQQIFTENVVSVGGFSAAKGPPTMRHPTGATDRVTYSLTPASYYQSGATQQEWWYTCLEEEYFLTGVLMVTRSVGKPHSSPL